MSYQEYQYSWPSDSYAYSYNTSQQYTSTTNSQGQYSTSDQFSTSGSQDYQYETNYSKGSTDTGDYHSSYSTQITSGSDSAMTPQYSEDQFSSYSAHNEPAYQSQTYQYSKSQTMHDSSSPNEMSYVTESSYSQPYQYSEPPPTQMEVSASNHAYGEDLMDSGYGQGGNDVSYDDQFSGSGQWDSGNTSTLDSYYPRNNATSSGMFLGDSTADSTSSYSGEMSSNTSGIYESTSNYFPHSYDGTNKTSYSSSPYHSRQGSRGSGYSRQGDRRQGGSNNFSRGGRTGRSSGTNRGGTFHSYAGTYNKPTQSHADVSRDGYRGGGSQFSGNRYNNSRSRGHNMPLSSPRSRGTSSFSRGLNGSRFNSNRGSSFQAKGPNTVQRGNQRGGFFAKPQRFSNSGDQKVTPPQNSAPPRIEARPAANVTQTQRKPPEPSTVETKGKLKAPSRPQDKLLNEIEEKEKAEKLEKERKEAEEKEKAEIARKSAEEARKAEEAAQQKIMEDARKKAEEMARKLAPPSKAPETPEEIAKEEEIQRKIRESVVVVDPVKEMAMLTEDPLKDLEMPEELRELLKTLTSDTFCKLCSLRMIGPHMAPMHYNGKNHLKKVRIFIQTNGRSAGFNMESAAVAGGEESTSGEKKEGEAEKEEEMEVDEKKYCKICKVSFSHASQYEMHYKGKNHAKKVRSLANSNEIFECKLCCVTVTAQEHLTAHLNGARHKLQIRKSSQGDTVRGRGGFYGRGGRGGMGNSENGFWKGGESNAGKQDQSQFQGRGRFDRGRGRGRGGFKRPADQNGLGSFNKRPRF